ncbi:hypothetical protein GGF40_001268 [Coemansia sp. RSA 1286]|nr:hypothetical protein GGF39_001135 [Coemansia sp. RSA 1721]KAJ2638937.1 hypothetical protein GGF40_001268 [Coemansia sp. RSA 1286]
MLHYGAISIALGTIVGGLNRYKFAENSAAVLYLGWSIWWLSLVLAIGSLVLLGYLLVSEQTQSIEAVTGAWLLLVAPLTCCAASGGIYSEYLPPKLSLLTVITGYCLLGAVLYQRRSAKIPFNISWWALVFPVGVFSLLTGNLSQTLEIRFFDIVFLLLVAVLFALWLFNVVRTVIGTWTGSIFGICELTQPCECCQAKADVSQMA